MKYWHIQTTKPLQTLYNLLQKKGQISVFVYIVARCFIPINNIILSEWEAIQFRPRKQANRDSLTKLLGQQR